jgi:hypothetical protein
MARLVGGVVARYCCSRLEAESCQNWTTSCGASDEVRLAVTTLGRAQRRHRGRGGGDDAVDCDVACAASYAGCMYCMYEGHCIY